MTHVRVNQKHGRDAVSLEFIPEFAGRGDTGVTVEGSISLKGQQIAAVNDLRATVRRPRLWWPAGQGDQSLYTAELVARDVEGRELSRWQRRIGLRTIELDRSQDERGERFGFVVNGRPIFLKGANWVPAHSFVTVLDREKTARDLRAAVAAHMNCVRVWGGGVYESEDFYDLCDELGLLVWQDFMFACTLSPADAAFCVSVKEEAKQQVRRLQHRACLALWCGNNELAQVNWEALRRPSLRRGYERMFHRLLPDVVRREDNVTPYWPTSQWRGSWRAGNDHAAGEVRGDTHYWDVWHARKPVKEYEKWRFRFVSEFGMQSYSSGESNARVCPPQDRNVFGPAMENHQKNIGGNQVILDYVSRRYRFPKSQADLIYLSQLNQAHCMQVGVEHYRRLMPHCMGAIYWQLNDCWPVASWSSIEHGGRWKALHWAARRFFAPALVSAHVPGDELTGIGNYRRSTVRRIHLWTSCDLPAAQRAQLGWTLCRMDGREIRAGQINVQLRAGQSRRWLTLDLAAELKLHGRDELYLRIYLDAAGQRLSEETVFMAPPRFLSLPRAACRVKVERVTPTVVRLRFASPVYQHRLMFELPGLPHKMFANYFDVYPNEPRVIRVEFDRPSTNKQIKTALQVRSLVDTYD